MDLKKLEALYSSLNRLTSSFKNLEKYMMHPDVLEFALDKKVSLFASAIVEEIVFLYDEIKASEFCEYLQGVAKLGYYEYNIRKHTAELKNLFTLGLGALYKGCFNNEQFFWDGWYYNNFHQIYRDVSKEITEISRMFDYYFPEREMLDKPQQINQEKTSTDILPSELNTDEALKYFAKAKVNGLIDDNYEWLKGKQLLSCFCHDMSQKLTLGKGNRIAWKPFEKLFRLKEGTLRSNYNDIQKTGQNPSDIALVDSIFQ